MSLKMTHDSYTLLHGLGKLVVLIIVAEIIHRPFARSGNGVTLLVELHAEVEAHATQDVANFAERFLAEILGGEHFPLRALHQIADGLDAGILQTIVGAHRELQLINGTIQLVVARQRWTFGLLVAVLLSV